MTFFLYTLAGMWAIGSFGMCVAFIVECFDTAIGKVITALLLLPIWVFIGTGPIFAIRHESGPELTRLLKSEWRCGAAHQETSTTMILVGKTMVPSTTTSTVCDAYVRGASD